jgi:IS5 family transposase
VRYPTDLGLCADAARVLARQGARVAHLAGAGARRVVDRSRAVRLRLRTLSRTLARRTGTGSETALRLTGEAGTIVGRSIAEARRLAGTLRARARGRGAKAKLAAAGRLEQITERAQKVRTQIRQRLAGERITDRLVSLADPDARPIRKGKLRQPTEFGYVVQLAELTESTRRGARGLILPASSRIGAAAESDLLPATAADMNRLGLRPRELALDGGFFPSGVAEHLPDIERTFIAGRQSAGSRRTNRRLARYRVGIEGRISHLKRRYGLRRSRLRGHDGARAWVAWAILAYNLDTLAIRGA